MNRTFLDTYKVEILRSRYTVYHTLTEKVRLYNLSKEISLYTKSGWMILPTLSYQKESYVLWCLGEILI